jgi:antirestriction protein ArdC
MAQTAGYRTPRFLTFKQALELGGNVRRGEFKDGVVQTIVATPQSKQMLEASAP